MKVVAVAASLVYLGQTGAIAASCDAYPEGIGATVVDTPAGVKIISTAEASVPIDDRDLYMDALTEATIEAKAKISSFMNETISKDCKINRKSESDIRITAEGKSVDVAKVKETICSLGESTSSLLRGVVTLGSCYTPGQFVRVTVGIKPETIAQAQRMSGQINLVAAQVQRTVVVPMADLIPLEDIAITNELIIFNISRRNLMINPLS